MTTNVLPSGVFRPAKPLTYQITQVLTQVGEIFRTLGEGVENARNYHELIQKGMAPRDAVRKVFETLSK